MRVRQMLSNLTGNAIKFTQQGRITLAVSECVTEAGDPMLEFSVSDTGIGLSDETQHRLFRPFTQADSSTTRQFGGTGLGLSIVRHLAQLMGGDAGVDSEVGQGSRFWFRIRAVPVSAAVESREIRRSSSPGDESVPDGLQLAGRVLVVEDNAVNRKVIGAMLTRLGVTVEFAEDGQQGVARVLQGEPLDLILMDLQMPVMNGYDATRQIRQWEQQQGRVPLRVIALTANAYESDRQQCLAAGMDDYLTKPIDFAHLQQVLLQGLGGRADLAVTTETRIFDAELMLEQLAGDQSLAHLMIEMLRADIPRLLDELAAEVECAHWAEAERRTHTLKGLAAQAGGQHFAHRSRQLDEQLKAGQPITAADVRELQAEYVALQTELECWVRGNQGTQGSQG
jgi:CheY-like chemotaxis protein/HPt (histidine-containing phosphotransfer) domain-containing protein